MGSCVQSAPCASFAYASSLAAPGDTVLVEDGTYGPQVVTTNGTASNQVTIEGSGVTLTRPSPAGDAIQNTPLLRVASSSYVTVEGFTLLGMKGRADYNSADTTPLYGEVDVSGAMGAGPGIVLAHLTVEHTNYTCIKLEDDEQYETIRDNTLVDCGAPGNAQEHGIYLSGGHNVVSGNTITTVSGYGIHAYQTSVIGVGNQTITGNVVRGAALAGIYNAQGPSTISGNDVSGNYEGMELSSQGGDVVIQRNVTSGNLASGITLHAEASGGQYVVENNTFYRNGYEEIGTAGSGPVPVTLLNNIFSGNNDTLLNGSFTTASVVGYNDYYNVQAPAVTGSGSIVADPLFVSPGDNFALEPTSPAIAAGTNVGLPYSGPAPDIGAVETTIRFRHQGTSGEE